MPHSAIGIGIIGSGYMGRTYAECIAHYNTGAHLVAVCQPCPLSVVVVAEPILVPVAFQRLIV